VPGDGSIAGSTLGGPLGPAVRSPGRHPRGSSFAISRTTSVAKTGETSGECPGIFAFPRRRLCYEQRPRADHSRASLRRDRLSAAAAATNAADPSGPAAVDAHEPMGFLSQKRALRRGPASGEAPAGSCRAENTKRT
jgi:hypothetical protein